MSTWTLGLTWMLIKTDHTPLPYEEKDGWNERLMMRLSGYFCGHQAVSVVLTGTVEQTSPGGLDRRSRALRRRNPQEAPFPPGRLPRP